MPSQRKTNSAMGRSMGKMKAKDDIDRRLAKQWELITVVRTRVRKGKEWLKIPQTEDGEFIMCSKTIHFNHQVLLAVLDKFGLERQTLKVLCQQAGL